MGTKVRFPRTTWRSPELQAVSYIRCEQYSSAGCHHHDNVDTTSFSSAADVTKGGRAGSGSQVGSSSSICGLMSPFSLLKVLSACSRRFGVPHPEPSVCNWDTYSEAHYLQSITDHADVNCSVVVGQGLHTHARTHARTHHNQKLTRSKHQLPYLCLALAEP